MYVIIPVYKRLTYTLKFINSFTTYITTQNTFILIDDSIGLEHVEYFDKTPHVIVLKGSGNLWWGGSVNVGINYLFTKIEPSSKDLICIANNDVVLTSSTWKPIKSILDKEDDIMVSPRVYNLQQKEIRSGANLKSWIPLRAKYAMDFSEEMKKVNLITGRFLCMHYSTLVKVGGISSNLPHYAGDWDFSLKAEKKGVKTYMLRASKCLVDESTTGNRYENGMKISEFYHALFTDIKSPQNLNYKYKFYRNHNGLVISIIGIVAEFFKTTFKYLLGKISRN